MKKSVIFIIYISFLLILFTGSHSSKWSDFKQEKSTTTLTAAIEEDEFERYLVYKRNGLDKEFKCLDLVEGKLYDLYKGDIEMVSIHNDKVVFYSDNREGKGIFLLKIGKEKPKLMLRDYVLLQRPFFSPDGEKVALYVSLINNNSRKGVGEATLLCVDLDTLKVVKIINTLNELKHISFLNSNTLLYTRKSEGGNYQIYTLSIGDKVEKPLFISSYNELSPSVAPDGSKIAYLSDKKENFNLYIYFINTGKRQELDIQDAVVGDSLKWSPKSNKLLYIALTGIAKYKIKLADTELYESKFLAEGYEAQFSKNGEDIIYATFDNARKVKSMEVQSINILNVKTGVSKEIWNFPEPGVFSRSISLLFLVNDLMLED